MLIVGAAGVLGIAATSDGTVDHYQKISDTQGNFTATLDNQDHFGDSVAAIGDLNNDGVVDLAAGAVGDDDGGTDRGAEYLVFLPPAAPSCLSATAVSSSQINLTWKDNSNNEDGFKIERKEQGGSYSQVGTAAANATSYSDTGLVDSGTTFCYRVRAYNGAGNSGYSNEHCDATATASTFERMYVTNWFNDTVTVANLDGSGATTFNPGGLLDRPVGIAVDALNRKMYIASWHPNDYVVVANLDGSWARALTLGGMLDGPNHITLDVAAGKMYVTSEDSNTVLVANLDGSSPTALTLGGTLNEPYGIALDVTAGKMYVQNYSGAIVNVVAANLDGSSPVVMDLSGALSNSRDIALDLVARKMYVVNTGTNSITRANLDGTCVEVLNLGGALNLPYGIALDVTSRKMYVANYGPDTVVVANLDGTNPVSLNLSGTLEGPTGIALGPLYKPAPEINVQRPAGTSISDGGTDNVGNQTVGTVNLTYTIDNTAGTDQLSVTGVTASNLSNVSNFSLNTATPINVAAGATVTFDISFDVDSNGAFSLDMDIANNDGDENPYDIAVSGNGTPGVYGKGDTDGDGDTDVVDARICLQIATGVIPGTPQQRAAADVDNDRDVDMDDATAIAEFIIGIRTTLP